MKIDLYYGPRGQGHTSRAVDTFNNHPGSAVYIGARTHRYPRPVERNGHVVLSRQAVSDDRWHEQVLGRTSGPSLVVVDDYFSWSLYERTQLGQLLARVQADDLYLSGTPIRPYYRVDIEEVRAARLLGKPLLMPLELLVGAPPAYVARLQAYAELCTDYITDPRTTLHFLPRERPDTAIILYGTTPTSQHEIRDWLNRYGELSVPGNAKPLRILV